MNIAYKVNVGVIKHNGVRYYRGELMHEDVFEDSDQLTRLLNLNALVKVAVEDETNETTIVVNPENGEAEKLTDDEPVDVVLDVNFEYAELVEQAKEELELTFKGNISKKDLIKLIIENNHEQHFLDQLED